jgi:hypothetical protein
MIQCPRCGAEKHRGRCKGGGSVKVKASPAPDPVKLNGSLEVAAGLGFRASLEDAQLVIEQDRQEDELVYTHQVTLSPSEARQLVDWLAEQVGAA